MWLDQYLLQVIASSGWPQVSSDCTCMYLRLFAASLSWSTIHGIQWFTSYPSVMLATLASKILHRENRAAPRHYTHPVLLVDGGGSEQVSNPWHAKPTDVQCGGQRGCWRQQGEEHILHVLLLFLFFYSRSKSVD